MKIIFNDKHPAQLPEISAYIDYARNRGFDAKKISEINLLNESDPDIYWTFMGVETKPQIKAKIYVQDYCSGSVGTGRALKNFLKTQINFKPDVRVFLNEYVHSLFHFSDNIPSIYRDMGVSKFFFEPNPSKRDGYVCVTNLSTQNELARVLEKFQVNNKNLTIVGPVEQEILNRFCYVGLNFLGRVDPLELAEILKKHEFGIILYRDVEPYTNQTSTRILEYCAAGLKVISTPTTWINKFYENDSYFKLSDEFDFEGIQVFKFSNPDVSQKTWEKEILKSGVFDFLEKRLKERKSRT